MNELFSKRNCLRAEVILCICAIFFISEFITIRWRQYEAGKHQHAQHINWITYHFRFVSDCIKELLVVCILLHTLGLRLLTSIVNKYQIDFGRQLLSTEQQFSCHDALSNGYCVYFRLSIKVCHFIFSESILVIFFGKESVYCWDIACLTALPPILTQN